MNKNLYTKELKRNRKNLLIWTSIVVGLTVLVLALFPYVKDMGKEMTAMLETMPEGMSKAMNLKGETWSNVLGMYNTYYGIYIIVIIGIYTTSTGATIISKEERDRTAEFLFTKPLSRKNIFITKMMSLFTLMTIIHLIQTAVAAISIHIFGEGTADWAIFATMQFHGFILVFFFTCLGVLLSMLLGAKKNYMGMAVGLVFGAFFLSAIAKSADGLGWIEYTTPFGYLDFGIFEEGYRVAVVSVIAFLLISIGLLVFSLERFKKMDIGA